MNVTSTFRKRLALPKTSWQLCLLAIVAGCAAASLVVVFSLTVEMLQQFYVTTFDNDISLNLLSRIQLPLIGVLFILMLSWATGYEYLRSGIPFVLHRLKLTYGVIPFRNTLNQFWGGAIALAAGFSVGREGPAVHLGAACASYVSQYLKLPNNSIRTLCACGIAAGISACFNTPIAAVIFVMEVILREYKVHIFIPIMLASIVGSMITDHFLGPVHGYGFFTELALTTYSYPWLIVFGIFLGILATGFNHYLTRMIKRFQHKSIVLRLISAAILTGLLSYIVPNAIHGQHNEILFALEHHSQWLIIVTLLVAKLLMTIIALGLGIPGGIIGPILGIGAIAGVAAALLISPFLASENLANDLALMGMAGFMAATLNAPLAALLAIIELSDQLDAVVPAMVVITTACLSSGQFFKNRSIFLMQLDVQNLTYRKAPVENSLQKIGVIAVMQEAIKLQHNLDNDTVAKLVLTGSSTDIIVNHDQVNNTFYWHEHIKNDHQDLVEIHQLLPLSSQETMAEAYLALRDNRIGGVYIYHEELNNIIGIIPFETIRYYLTEGKLSS
jgi:H+/Cl- antiporter ClcA